MDTQIRKFSIEKALKKDKEDFISWVQKKYCSTRISKNIVRILDT